MKRKILYLNLLLAIFLLGCSKSDDEVPSNGICKNCIPLSFAPLTVTIDGDVYSDLDPGSQEYQDFIACAQNCALTNPDDPQCIMNCLSTSGLMPSGGAFMLSMELDNDTDADIPFNLNPGTWFYSSSDDYQCMLLVTEISVLVPAHQTVTEKIPVFCMAADKSAPDISSQYTACATIASTGCLSDIIDILEAKDMSALSLNETMQVQTIIWNCIEGEAVDWDYLNGLPD